MSDIEFSRPVRVEPLPRGGLMEEIEANPEERAALARLNGLPSIERVSASFRILKWGKGVRVEGELSARVTRICVVSLEPFEVEIDEPIEAKFVPENARPPSQEEYGLDDEPDTLINGRIDLGALASEFLTLSLDPYPRKPGVEFAPPSEAPEPESPFNRLRALGNRDEPD